MAESTHHPPIDGSTSPASGPGEAAAAPRGYPATSELARLAAALADALALRVSAEAQLREQAARIEALTAREAAAAAEHTAYIAFWKEEVARLEQTQAEQEERIARLKADLSEQRRERAEHVARIAELERQLAERDARLAEREGELAELRERLAERERAVEQLERRLGTLGYDVEQRDLSIAGQARAIAILKDELARKDARIAELEVQRLAAPPATAAPAAESAPSTAPAATSPPAAEAAAGGTGHPAVGTGRRYRIKGRAARRLPATGAPATRQRLRARLASRLAASTRAVDGVGRPGSNGQAAPAAPGAGVRSLPELFALDARPALGPRAEKYDIVCFSIINWEFRWQRPQQIASEFAARGHRVFYFSPTKFPNTLDRWYHVEPLRENVWEVQLATPFFIDIYGGEMPRYLARHVVAALKQLRLEFNIEEAVSLVQVATWAPAAYEARDLFGWRIVYDCMDEWNTFPGMHKALLREEARLVREADLLVVTAQRLWEKWSPYNRNTVLARNAADFAHFQNPKPNTLLADVRGPVVGYFGAIADWFDLDLMLRLARERPSYTFVLLGGVFDVDVEELAALPNVRLLGQQPYALMPQYLEHFDVCIIPFKVNAVTEATDPVKFYEYISQGKPVVAPRMPELFPYRDYLYIAEDHDDFIEKVDRALREGDPALRERRIALARQNTWADRVDRIQQGIVRAHPRASVVVVTYNNLEYTRLCLESVLRNTHWPDWELIVVDNASTDGTPEYLHGLAERHGSSRPPEQQRVDVRVILNGRNLGFAAANNRGLAEATGDYLILLNNDTVAPPGWLNNLVKHLRRPEIGLVVAVTNFSGNESRVEVNYIDRAGMEEFAQRYTSEHLGEVFDIRVAAMYCVALRRDVYTRVGPLDEGFSVGLFEDDDYSHRIRLAGYRVVCAEDAFIHHFGQSSFKQLSPEQYQAIWDRNQRYYESKWGLTWTPHTGRAS